MISNVRLVLGLVVCCLAPACSSAGEAKPKGILLGADAGGSAANADAGDSAANADAGDSATGADAGDSDAGVPKAGGESIDAETTELEVPVPEGTRVYVKLAGPSLVTPSAPADSSEWDLAFQNFDVYTNSGPSGTKSGAAFGPLDVSTLIGDALPTVPFLSPDKAGGAFIDWYAYDGKSHALYSRYHVYGVKSGDRLWKMQVLSYYAEQDSAPVSALYQVRYAELGAANGETRTLQVDGTAGGLTGSASSPSGCVDLATGAQVMLTPTEARASKAWDLCFRRDSISVNGEVGGPRGTAAVDLRVDQTNSEALADVQKETADSALPRFAQVSLEAFTDAPFRGDHVVSAFETGTWVDPNAVPPSPENAAWLVLDALGKQQFLVAFSTFRNATTSSPGTVVMHVKPVKQ